ncbi:phage tail protein [Candidatus Chloroploca sp. M-50]|uniref:Phage tail protein n=1 Tax=Candidatus Chloroploca mongolica TaxID=2528176 RepID=A0ABS4DA54_9CHLR|nr:phage tail protein [Candidatus Chloroploca mongolica]MBP1466295.1 phage tail protein [Candidatus Chloroploca mongolica]
MSDPGASGGQAGVFADPYRVYNFKLEIQGITAGHFTECSGFDIQVHAIRYRQGGVNEVVHRVPGPVTYGDIELRYGLTDSRELWDWFMTAVEGRVQRKNISILMLDSRGVAEVMRWDCINAWPARWRGAPLNALDHALAIETLTIVFETLDRA